MRRVAMTSFPLRDVLLFLSLQSLPNHKSHVCDDDEREAYVNKVNYELHNFVLPKGVQTNQA